MDSLKNRTKVKFVLNGVALLKECLLYVFSTNKECPPSKKEHRTRAHTWPFFNQIRCKKIYIIGHFRPLSHSKFNEKSSKLSSKKPLNFQMAKSLKLPIFSAPFWVSKYPSAVCFRCVRRHRVLEIARKFKLDASIHT